MTSHLPKLIRRLMHCRHRQTWRQALSGQRYAWADWKQVRSDWPVWEDMPTEKAIRDALEAHQVEHTHVRPRWFQHWRVCYLPSETTETTDARDVQEADLAMQHQGALHRAMEAWRDDRAGPADEPKLAWGEVIDLARPWFRLALMKEHWGLVHQWVSQAIASGDVLAFEMAMEEGWGWHLLPLDPEGVLDYHLIQMMELLWSRPYYSPTQHGADATLVMWRRSHHAWSWVEPSIREKVWEHLMVQLRRGRVPPNSQAHQFNPEGMFRWPLSRLLTWVQHEEPHVLPPTGVLMWLSGFTFGMKDVWNDWMMFGFTAPLTSEEVQKQRDRMDPVRWLWQRGDWKVHHRSEVIRGWLQATRGTAFLMPHAQRDLDQYASLDQEWMAIWATQPLPPAHYRGVDYVSWLSLGLIGRSPQRMALSVWSSLIAADPSPHPRKLEFSAAQALSDRRAYDSNSSGNSWDKPLWERLEAFLESSEDQTRLQEAWAETGVTSEDPPKKKRF